MILEDIADKITQYFAKFITREEIELAKMKLGIEVLLHDVCMIGLILLLALYLSILTETLIFMLVFGIFRMVSGGIHLKSSIGCLIGTGCMVIGGVKISEMLTINILQTVVLFIILIIITYWLSPQGTENNPIGQSNRISQKYCSCILVFSYMMTAICCSQIRDLITLAALFEVVTLILQHIKTRWAI